MLEAFKITKLTYETKLQILAEVIAKQKDILQTNWYDINLSLADLVTEESESEDFSHITDVQERINAGFRKGDTLEVALLDLIANNRFAKYKDGRGYFITTKYLQAALGDELRLDGDRLANRLARISASTTFKYKIPEKYARPTEGQLEFPTEQIRMMYMRDINNAQRMIVGYALLQR